MSRLICMVVLGVAWVFCLPIIYRQVSESSIVAVQIFDHRKWKKKDQGFLGVINIKVGDVLDIGLGGEGTSAFTRKFLRKRN